MQEVVENGNSGVIVPPQFQQAMQVNNAVDSSMQQTLFALFNHFQQVYERGYTQAKIAHPESGNGVLDLFLQYFPQLHAAKTYRYRSEY